MEHRGQQYQERKLKKVPKGTFSIKENVPNSLYHSTFSVSKYLIIDSFPSAVVIVAAK